MAGLAVGQIRRHEVARRPLGMGLFAVEENVSETGRDAHLYNCGARRHQLERAARLGETGLDDMPTMTFYGWLEQQRRRRDYVGRLALDYYTEPACCLREREIMASLKRLHGGQMLNIKKAMRLAWSEYQLALALQQMIGATPREADGSPKK